MDPEERVGGLGHITEADLPGEYPRRLHRKGQWVDDLADRLVPAQQRQRSQHIAAVVGDDGRESCSQDRLLGAFTPVEADRLGRVAHPDQGVAEGGVGQFVSEIESDQRPTDPERDHGGGEDVDQGDPEQRMAHRDAEERQFPGQVPQDRGERHHRHHRVDRTEQQGAGRLRGGGIGTGTGGRGEAIDIELDALVGIVDRLGQEPAAVERLLIEPVARQSVGQPHPPSDDEVLGQIDVE